VGLKDSFAEVWRGSRRRGWLTTALVLAALAGVAVLAERYRISIDLTAVGRNSLGDRSVSVLQSLEQPVSVTVFAREQRLPRAAASELLDRYRRVEPRFEYRFVDPDADPELLRSLGARGAGDIVIEYDGRQEILREHSEAAITTALERLARRGERWIAALTGHGERDLGGDRNFDLGRFGKELRTRGYRVRALDLTSTEAVPQNAALLLIADPRIDLSPGTVQRLIEYLARGGNLLWLTEPDARFDGGALADTLGVKRLAGHLEDRIAAGSFGLDDPRFLVIGAYPAHALTQTLDLQTLFPGTAALVPVPSDGGFEPARVLSTSSRAEQVDDADGGIRKEVGATGARFGYALTRAGNGGVEQRVAVIGDADFLANSYVGNGGNLQLGLALVRWLTGADAMVGIATRDAPDLRLELSQATMLVIALGALFGMPLLLLATGLIIRTRRRQR